MADETNAKSSEETVRDQATEADAPAADVAAEESEAPKTTTVKTVKKVKRVAVPGGTNQDKSGAPAGEKKPSFFDSLKKKKPEKAAAAEPANSGDGKKKKERFTGPRATKIKEWGAKKAGRFYRWQITLVTCVVVFGAAGVGMLVWHETPGFCDAICHNSMDGYLPTYEAVPGESTVDKWGNTVADASSMLAPVHRAYGDVTCLQCHKPALLEQATEGIEYVTGMYVAPLSERNLTNLTAYENYDDTSEFCLNENCHNMTKADLTNATSDLVRNPHSWHHFQYTCTDCHKSHRASVLVCTQCHDDSFADLPAGWISNQDAKELETIYPSLDEQRADS